MNTSNNNLDRLDLDAKHRQLLSKRLANLMKSKGIKPKELAQKLDVSYESVRRYIKAEALPRNSISEKMADIFEVSPTYIKFGIDEQQIKADSIASLGTLSENNELDTDTDEVLVPFLKDTQLAAGTGCFDLDDYSDSKLKFSRFILAKKGIKPESVVCFSVRGNSMHPVLPNNTVVAINTRDLSLKDGDIYAFEQGGLLRIKLLYRLPDNLVKIKSYNDYEYPEEQIHLSKINVIGRIFWWQVVI